MSAVTHKHTARISGHSADHRKNQIVFVAIETAVPARDVVEFAAVVVDKHGLYELESYATLVKSDKVSADSVAVNGISEKMLEHAPAFVDVALDIASLLEGRIVAGYTVAQDLAQIKKNFEAIKHAPPTESAVLDIAPLLREQFGGRAAETKLDALGQYFGLGGKKNRAVEDCRLAIAVLKNAALSLFLERSLPNVFPAPSYAAAAINARTKAADLKTPRQQPAASPVAAVPPVEEEPPKRKKAKQHDETAAAPAAAAAAKSAETQFAQPIFAFQPQQPTAAPAQPAQPATKVRPSPIQRPSQPTAQPSTIFSQIAQPAASPAANGSAASAAAARPAWGQASAGAQAKPANLLVSPGPSAPITTSASTPNAQKADAKAAPPSSPLPASTAPAPAASPIPAIGTAAAVAAATANSKKKWSTITEMAEKVKTPTAGGPTTPGGTAISAVTPRTAPTPTAAKKATTPSAAAAAEPAWAEVKAKPTKKATTPSNGTAAAAADDEEDDATAVGWQTTESRKTKRAAAAREQLANTPRDAAGKARDKAYAKNKAGTGSSRPPLDEYCVAYLEDAIAKKKKCWIMYFNPVAGTKPRHILPLAWEKRPALLKALVEGEQEPAYFTTRKIVEIRDQNTFDTPPAPIADQ